MGNNKGRIVEKHTYGGLVIQKSEKNAILRPQSFIHLEFSPMNPQTLLAIIRQHLLRSPGGGNVVRIILYGSRVQGKADNDSDVDLLCILKPSADWKERRALRNSLGEIELQYDLLFDVRFLSTDDLMTIQAKQPFVRSALDEGISAAINETTSLFNQEISV